MFFKRLILMAFVATAVGLPAPQAGISSASLPNAASTPTTVGTELPVITSSVPAVRRAASTSTENQFLATDFIMNSPTSTFENAAVTSLSKREGAAESTPLTSLESFAQATSFDQDIAEATSASEFSASTSAMSRRQAPPPPPPPGAQSPPLPHGYDSHPPRHFNNSTETDENAEEDYASASPVTADMTSTLSSVEADVTSSAVSKRHEETSSIASLEDAVASPTPDVPADETSASPLNEDVARATTSASAFTAAAPSVSSTSSAVEAAETCWDCSIVERQVETPTAAPAFNATDYTAAPVSTSSVL